MEKWIEYGVKGSGVKELDVQAWRDGGKREAFSGLV